MSIARARKRAFSLSAAALVAVVAVTLAMAACASSESGSPSAGRTSLPGGDDHIAQTVKVNGRNLFLECSGTGSPTVVLQSGYGNAGDIWSLTDTTSPAVFPAIAKTNRVCTYDRPGSTITTTKSDGTVTLAKDARRGRSDPAPMPRDPADVVTELHDLLVAADVPGPYVLVGHSLGGALNILYARTYPDEVGALVTVDSPLPPWREILGPEMSELMAVVTGGDPGSVDGYKLESYDLDTLFDEIDAAGPLPDIPVVVVRRGGKKLSDDPLPEGAPLTEAQVDVINAAQWNGQAVWAASVPGAELVTVAGTTHYVQNQRPDAVVKATLDAITRI